jgi:cell division protease FtsH
MKEVKPSRKSMMSYALLVILFMMIINAFVMPSVERASIQEVDYGTFMTMTAHDRR